MYSIKELAALAGLTTRTLRYYDKMNLLKPAAVGENGYRYYDRQSLLTLQQILYYKELDLPLKEIQYILNRPDFQLLPALQKQRRSLREKIGRCQELLGTIDRTIEALEGGQTMKPEELFTGFDEKRYAEEARQLWGNTPHYQESHRKWSSYSEAQKGELKQLGGQITMRMVTENPQARPDDPEVQAAVREYFEYLNRYFYRCDVAFFRKLGDMWVEDPRFAVNYERIRQGGAEFVRDAVRLFCDRADQG